MPVTTISHLPDNRLIKVSLYTARLRRFVLDKNHLALTIILALGAFLRLINLTHLFNVMHDYDEGAYALGGHLISQGQLPYSDYLLVHPPLYNLVLSWVYNLFGYDFFYGRYLSVALSLISIFLIYLIGRKLYHARAGLLAAALFAVEPMMVYLGRRGVQEPLGLLLVLIALYFATDFIKQGKTRCLLWVGIALGLALSAKYLFLAAAAGMGVAIAVLILGQSYWNVLRTLGNPRLWLLYAAFVVLLYCPLIIMRWGLHADVPVPFFVPITEISAQSILVLILTFVMPFLAAVVVLKINLIPADWKAGIKVMFRSRAVWLVTGGILIGLFLVIGFFLIKSPEDFLNQTVFLQANHPLLDFPSLVAIINSIPKNDGFLKLTPLPILLIIPLVLLLLNRKDTSRSDIFIITALAGGFLVCQVFSAMPRYYATVYPLLFLGIGSLLPLNFSFKLLNHKLRFWASLALLAVFLSISFSLLTNYTGYDVLNPGPVYASQEESMYRDTIAYLEDVGAKKIFATSPSITAMSADFATFRDFDLFALIFLEHRPPQQIVNDLKSNGVEYVILDPWLRYWGPQTQVVEFSRLIRQSSRLVKVVEPSAQCRAEIYLLGDTNTDIFNGDFSQWSTQNGVLTPLGWSFFNSKGDGDRISVSQAEISGVDCVKLEVVENGLDDGATEYTMASIYQQTPFPQGQVKFRVLPEVNTSPGVSPQYAQGLHFVDASGRVLVIGFSDRVSEELTFTSTSGTSRLIIKPAALGQWADFTVDVAQYWVDAGWPVPQNISIYVILSAHYSTPGQYALYIAGIQTQ